MKLPHKCRAAILTAFSVTLVAATCGAGEDAGSGGLPAFPGAEGYGAASKGGRGGKVIKVTNLNAKGPGSLQAACEAPGPRIVVFEVSGVIPAPTGRGYGNAITIRGGNITIAGQTAPGAGITIAGGLCSNGGRDITVRFLRIRPPNGMRLPANGDAIHFAGCNRLIFDHVSIAWGTDENCGVTLNNNMTLQDCFIEEANMAALEGWTLHNFGMLLGYNAGRTSLLRNLWLHHAQRMPAVSALKPGGLIDFRNNVCYNGYLGIVGVPRGNVVGNYLIDGPGGPTSFYHIHKPTVRRTWTGIGGKSIHAAGNYYTWLGGYTAVNENGKAISRLPKALPVPMTGTLTARQAYKRVLGQGGCLPRDPVGRRSAQEVLTRTGFWGRDDPQEGLLGDLKPGKAPKDSDGDGMPDEWEKAHKLDPADPKDAGKVVPKDASKGDRHAGYTYIEYYVNEKADELVADALAHPERTQKYTGKVLDDPLKIAPLRIGVDTKRAHRKPAEGEIKTLIEDLANVGSKDKKARTKARRSLLALREIGPAAVPQLIAALKHENAKVRGYAALALGRVRPVAREAVPAMLEALTAKDSERVVKHGGPAACTVAALMFWMGRPAGKEHLPALIKLLEAENQFARGYATAELGEMGADAAEAVPGLVKVLSDADINNRWSAAWALGEIGAARPEVTAALVKALGDSQVRMRLQAGDALAKLCKDALPGDLVKALGSDDAQVKWGAAWTLGEVGPPAASAAAALSKLLSDPAVRVRQVTAWALGRIGPGAKDTAGALKAALADKDWHVRAAAASALGRIGAKAETKALEKAAKDERAEVRGAAAAALEKLR